MERLNLEPNQNSGLHRLPFRGLRLALFLAFLIAGTSSFAWAAPVLMISIDGLKPEYVTHAKEHGLVLPVLTRFLREGVYADGVIPVLPTLTYPDHTTLITGVWPAEHGILSNELFDPERHFAGAWYWYAESIRVPTLWDVAHQAGISTASVSWPVSVNATSVDSLIPEYWRSSSPAAAGNPQDRYLMVAISRPDGMLAEMERRLGPYMMGNDTTLAGDGIRTRFSLDILKKKKPGLMTIHLSSLDEAEHLHGPFSVEADKTLEGIDGMVGQLMNAALKNDPQTRIFVVSDHGFLTVTHVVNLSIPFLQAGFVQLGKRQGFEGETTVVSSWKAQLWTAGGLGAVMLHDSADTATANQVHALLMKLAADPANGIARILDKQEIAKEGGFTGASYLMVMKPGYNIGSATSGPLVQEVKEARGNHGFSPQYPEMRASFFVMGQGIAHGRDLGVIDMRRIAPTVAGVLGVPLPAAKQPKLPIAP